MTRHNRRIMTSRRRRPLDLFLVCVWLVLALATGLPALVHYLVSH